MTEEKIEKEAAIFIESLANKHNLKLEFIEETDVLWWKLPVQKGLSFEIDISFQNIDEIWFLIDGLFTYSVFPFPSVAEHFEDALDGFINGNFRIRSDRFSSYLEEPKDGGWERIFTYSGRITKNYRNQVIQNLQK